MATVLQEVEKVLEREGLKYTEDDNRLVVCFPAPEKECGIFVKEKGMMVLLLEESVSPGIVDFIMVTTIGPDKLPPLKVLAMNGGLFGPRIGVYAKGKEEEEKYLVKITVTLEALHSFGRGIIMTQVEILCSLVYVLCSMAKAEETKRLADLSRNN